MSKLEGGAKVLEEYFKTLVDDGLLDIGSVDPTDCLALWDRAIKAEQEVRNKEFAR